MKKMTRQQRLDAFDTTHILNYSQIWEDYGRCYGDWMREAHRLRPSAGTNAVAVAKSVLGPHDYCYVTWYQAWIWEREVTVIGMDGNEVQCHWRLSASHRGFHFEVEAGETTFPTTYGSVLRAAFAKRIWDEFLKTWKEKAALLPRLPDV